MCVAGVLKGLERRDVMSRRRSRRFFIEPGGRPSISERGRVRFRLRQHFLGTFGKDRRGPGIEPAVNLKTASKGETARCGAVKSMTALETRATAWE